MSQETEKTMVDYASVSFTTMAGSGPDQTNIVVQTHIDVTQDAGDIDNQLDMISARLERQRVIGEIPARAENIERMTSQIKQMESDTKRLDKEAQADWQKSGRSGDFKLSKANQKNRDEVEINVKNLKDRIKDEQNKLEYAIEVRDGKLKVKAVKTA
jgi:hypothetical protein